MTVDLWTTVLTGLAMALSLCAIYAFIRYRNTPWTPWRALTLGANFAALAAAALRNDVAAMIFLGVLILGLIALAVLTWLTSQHHHHD